MVTKYGVTMAGHSGDVVFDHLAGAILRGDLPAQSTLPPERVFAERYGVSRIIVRQAVHRLADMGLVRVRQGGATTVLDPEEADRPARAGAVLSAGAGRVVAARSQRHDREAVPAGHVDGERGGAARRRRVAAADRAAGRGLRAGDQKRAPVEELEEQFWRALAKAGGNRIFVIEVAGGTTCCASGRCRGR